MTINYKKELETAAKNMILVHHPDTLIKMIVRIIVQKVRVKHAGILLHDRDRNTYILTVSRGSSGLRIPAGFARMDIDNPLISFFREQNKGFLVYEKAKALLKNNEIGPKKRKMLKGVLYQMEMFKVEVCIPSYFRDDLLGILLLGGKKNNKRFRGEELDFFVALASDVSMAIRNARLFEELETELGRNKKLFINTTIALAQAIEAKDHYTAGHTERVTNLSLEIAKKLKEKNKKLDFNEKLLEQLYIASLLHDIGKIGVPESILNKGDTLNEEEIKRMQEHPLVGLNILTPIMELKDALPGVKYHHERYDGTGYPDGLKEDQIPIIASIISIADAFDAMTTDRPYRKALTRQEAIEEVRRASGKQFAPNVVEALIELYQENKI